MTEHISKAMSDLYCDLFDRSVRRLDTQLERGEITLRQHRTKLRHMVEAAS